MLTLVNGMKKPKTIGYNIYHPDEIHETRCIKNNAINNCNNDYEPEKCCKPIITSFKDSIDKYKKLMKSSRLSPDDSGNYSVSGLESSGLTDLKGYIYGGDDGGDDDGENIEYRAYEGRPEGDEYKLLSKHCIIDKNITNSQCDGYSKLDSTLFNENTDNFNLKLDRILNLHQTHPEKRKFNQFISENPKLMNKLNRLNLGYSNFNKQSKNINDYYKCLLDNTYESSINHDESLYYGASDNIHKYNHLLNKYRVCNNVLNQNTK